MLYSMATNLRRTEPKDRTMAAIPGMEDYPIKLGTLLFTMVEPERAWFIRGIACAM